LDAARAPSLLGSRARPNDDGRNSDALSPLGHLESVCVARSIIYLQVQKINYDKNKHTGQRFFLYASSDRRRDIISSTNTNFFVERGGCIWENICAVGSQFCHPEV
jgi:hypothetical protein